MAPLKCLHTAKPSERGAARGAGVPQGLSHLQQPHCHGSQGKGAVRTQQFQLLIMKRLKWNFLLLLHISRLMLFTLVLTKIWELF